MQYRSDEVWFCSSFETSLLSRSSSALSEIDDAGGKLDKLYMRLVGENMASYASYPPSDGDLMVWIANDVRQVSLMLRAPFEPGNYAAYLELLP